MGLYKLVAGVRSRGRLRRARRDLERFGQFGEDVHLTPNTNFVVSSTSPRPIQIGDHVWLDGTIIVRARQR